MKKFGFSHSSRLHTPAEFKAVFQQPIRSSSHSVTVLARPNQQEGARLGVIIAKRSLPRAVDRNRVRRLVRECFRLSKDELIGLDVIVLAKSGLKNFREASTLCRHLRQRWDEIIRQQSGMEK